MPTPIQQDEEDVVRYYDSPAAPLAPPIAQAPYNSTVQAPPVASPGNVTGSPAPVIDAAVGQLNAGQPVTALPHQDWSLQQATAFNAKLDAFDQQAKHARIAADQAARDAHLFDQMSRVAKSTKDIEIALQQQDVMGFRNAVASGTPGYQALQRFPRAATSPLVAAMHAAQPVAPPTFGKSPGGAEYMQDSHGVHFTPRSGALPDAAVKTLPDGTRIIQVSPEKWQVLDKGAAKPGTLDAAARTEIGLLKSEKAALDKEMASGAWLAKSAVPEFKAQQDAANQRLVFITKRLGELLPGAYPTAAPATNAPARSAVRNPKTGQWEWAK